MNSTALPTFTWQQPPSTKGLIEFTATLQDLSKLLKQQPKNRQQFPKHHFHHLDKLFKAALDCHTETKQLRNEWWLLQTNDYYAALYIFFHEIFRKKNDQNREDGVFETFLRYTRKILRQLAYSTSKQPIALDEELYLEIHITALNNEAQKVLQRRINAL